VEASERTSRKPPADEPASWHPSLATRLGMMLAALAAAMVTLAVLLAVKSDWRSMMLALVQAPHSWGTQLRESGPLVALPVALALTAGALTYRTLRLIVLVSGWRAYLVRLAGDLSARIELRAPLHALGYAPSAQVAGIKAPGEPAQMSLSQAMHAHSRLLLVGDDGAGKTTALLLHAHEIARGATVGAIISGRQLIPIIVPLPQYVNAAPSPDGLRLDVLAATLRHYGARRLASQLPTLLRRGRVLLLLDGLDELATTQAQDVLRELDAALRQRYRGLRIILTCHAATLREMIDHAPLLRHLPQASLLSLTPIEIAQTLRRAARSGRLGTSQPDAVREQIDALGLGVLFSMPAYLAMLLDVLAAGQDLPVSRAALLAAYEDLLFERASVTDVRRDRALRALGYLAVALRLMNVSEISGAEAWNEREAVRALLADSSSAIARLGGNTRPTGLNETDLTEAIDLACMAGVLERGTNGNGLRFRHMLLLHLSAAQHLEANDTGLGRISPLLLRPEWAKAVILWGELSTDPAGLTERLGRLAQSPIGAAATAQLVERERGVSLALALALTVATLGMAASALAATENASDRKRAEFDQHALREIFELTLRLGSAGQGDDTERRARLAKALQQCDESSGGELTPTLARIVRSSHVQRLLRAQAVQILGAMASPASLAELTALLLEPDPIVREALQRGFHLAGTEAAAPLLDLMAGSTPGSTAYRRALEALVAVDGPAALLALERLKDPSPAMRAAAATALGAMRTRQALDALLNALHDHDLAVRLAATRALGKLGDIKAQAALLELLSVAEDDQLTAAIEAVGMLRGERALKPLLKLLDDRRPRVRAAAAEALGHIGDVRAVDPLRRHLADRDAWAQASAATALRALGQRA
jgi:HEAT repeat protein